MTTNIFLGNIPSHYKLDYTNIILNYLIRDEVLSLTDEFWSFGGDGTFYMDERNVHHNDKLLKLGYYAPDQGDFQIFFSNASASSLLLSYA